MKSCLLLILIILTIISCDEKGNDRRETYMTKLPGIKKMISEFAPAHITADLSFLTEREKKLFLA